MRLNPVVRDALCAVLETLGATKGLVQCCTMARGIFVPLEQFDRRGIPPALALRALADARMLVLVGANGQPTISREFDGSATVGLVIDPRFVEGMDLDAFELSDPQGA